MARRGRLKTKEKIMTLEISNIWLMAITSMAGGALGSFLSILVINHMNQKKWQRKMAENQQNGEPDCGCNKAKTAQNQN
tara:strand:+ start:33 stop:269 length:237 start_codon:yes stop_codon:yes gene_type:complete